MALMHKLIASLTDRACQLGGLPLRPKRQGNHTSLAFTFRDAGQADSFCKETAAEPIKVQRRSTYQATLVTVEVPS